MAKEITPQNTTDTYAKSWRVWTRICNATGLPPTEGSRGALVAYVTWMLREGRTAPDANGVLGYAPSSAGTHLAATVTGLRQRGHEVSKDDAAAADGARRRAGASGGQAGRAEAGVCAAAEVRTTPGTAGFPGGGRSSRTRWSASSPGR
ncbi:MULTISPECIES: hypothetical protein [unclassified Streptomyces]|uniref:hypothetical protein n=1 Tax=unclassified Streptomyces TaxID=2593676 RepID=UPI00343F830A